MSNDNANIQPLIVLLSSVIHSTKHHNQRHLNPFHHPREQQTKCICSINEEEIRKHQQYEEWMIILIKCKHNQSFTARTSYRKFLFFYHIFKRIEVNLDRNWRHFQKGVFKLFIINSTTSSSRWSFSPIHAAEPTRELAAMKANCFGNCVRKTRRKHWIKIILRIIKILRERTSISLLMCFAFSRQALELENKWQNLYGWDTNVKNKWKQAFN